MRLMIYLTLTCLLLASPNTSFGADGGTSVRAIAFVASNDSGPTDRKLAPYEAILRSNLRFESFRYAGENSTSVPPGGATTLSLPNGGSVRLECDKSGSVKVHRGETVVTVSPGHPAVFMSGRGGKGGAPGVIVMTR